MMFTRQIAQSLARTARYNSTTVTTLDNSVRVGSTNLPNTDSQTVALLFNAGSVDDPAGKNGVAGVLGRIAAAESKPEEGVVLTSFVHREQMGIVAHTKSGADAALNTISRAVSSMSEAKNFEQRVAEVNADFERVDMTSAGYALDQVHSVAFQESPLAFPVNGSPDSVSNIDSKTLSDFVKTHLTGGRAAIAAAGDVSHNDFVSSAAKAVGALPSNSDYDFNGAPAIEYTGSMVNVREDSLPIANTTITFKSTGKVEDDFKFYVLTEIFGNWNRQYGDGKQSTSPLVQEWLSDDVSGTSLNTFFCPYRSTGLFGLNFHSTRGELEHAVWNAFRQFARIAEGVTTSEVERAKTRFIRNLVKYAESPNTRAQASAYTLLRSGVNFSEQDTTDQVLDIKRDDIRNFVFQNLVDQDPAVATIGQTAFFPDYNQLRGWTYWNRL